MTDEPRYLYFAKLDEKSQCLKVEKTTIVYEGEGKFFVDPSPQSALWLTNVVRKSDACFSVEQAIEYRRKKLQGWAEYYQDLRDKAVQERNLFDKLAGEYLERGGRGREA